MTTYDLLIHFFSISDSSDVLMLSKVRNLVKWGVRGSARMRGPLCDWLRQITWGVPSCEGYGGPFLWGVRGSPHLLSILSLWLAKTDHMGGPLNWGVQGTLGPLTGGPLISKSCDLSKPIRGSPHGRGPLMRADPPTIKLINNKYICRTYSFNNLLWWFRDWVLDPS